MTSLPRRLFEKYLARFDELIAEGQALKDSIKTIPGGYRQSSMDRIRGTASLKNPDRQEFDSEAFKKWRVNYASLLEQIIPDQSVHKDLIRKPGAAWDAKGNLENHLSILKAIKDDFEKGFLGDLSLQIEAEIAADYMGQAEQLLAEGQTGQFDHVPAAVLAGAVLEKGLRTLCSKQTPPLPLVDGKGNPLMMNRLIDDLKKAGAFTELKAKQLRAWADIRNKAAHGEFSEFSRSDVETMIGSINNFLADYLA